MVLEPGGCINPVNLINIHLQTTCSRPKHPCSLSTVNMRSLNGKSSLLMEHVISAKIDLCLITEVWINNTNTEVMSDLNSQGYEFVPIPRKNRPGGGIGLLHRATYSVKLEKSGAHSSFEYAEWLVSAPNTSALRIVGIYHPPYSQVNPVTNSVFISELGDYLEYILVHSASIVMLGDMNIRYNDMQDPDNLAYQDLLSSMSLTQHILFSTHKSGNTLDHVISKSCQDIVISNPTSGPWMSDHCLVQCYCSLPNMYVVHEVTQYRKIKINISEFRSSLLLNLDSLHSCEHLDDLLDQFNHTLTTTLDEFAPLQTKMVTKRPRQPWFTQDLNILKRNKRRAEKTWRKHGHGHDHLWKSFVEQRTIFVKALKSSKKQILSAKVQECGIDTKKLYQLVNHLICRSATNPMPECPSTSLLCEQFSDFFMDKIVSIRNNLQQYPVFEPSGNRSTNHELTAFDPFSRDEVTKLVSMMKTKTCELDPLPASLLSQCHDVLIPAYTLIINKSFSECSFSNTWKTAVVQPLLKKPGLDRVPKNYRPVSNLSYVSKLVEKAVLNRMLAYDMEAKILPAFQSAYRKDHSCETALLRIHNDALWAMEEQKVMPLVAIDLSAAFDTVDHGVLLSVLQKECGVGADALEWFQSYLRPRYMKVRINSEYSEPKLLDFSVPQGSVLGPQLFSVYASTLGDVIADHTCVINGFADDHTLHNTFSAGNSTAECEVMADLVESLKDVGLWMQANRLKMNSDKTEFVIFGTPYQKSKISTTNIQVLGDTVDESAAIKLLGVTLDGPLSLRQHITRISSICFMNLQKIRSIRKFLDTDSCRTLVQGLVMSYLDYCNSLYMGLPEQDMIKLQRIQNAAARLITNIRRKDSVTLALENLHWLKVKDRVMYKVMTLMYKTINGSAPQYLLDLIQLVVPTRQLRSSQDDLRLDWPRTSRSTFADRSISVYGPKNWNELPYAIRSSKNIVEFKSKLKTYLFN